MEPGMSDESEALAFKENEAPPAPEDSFFMLDHPPLPPDIIKGVRGITLYLHGTGDKKLVRSVYHQTEKSNTIPTFKLGSMTCVRRSSIRATIWMQERRAWPSPMEEDLVRLHVLLSGILTLLSEHNGHIGGDRDETQLRALLAEGAKTISRVIQIDAANDDRPDIREAG
jgi:hypothetical protein